MNYSDIVVIVVLALMVGFVVVKKLLDDKSKNELKQFLSYISDKFEKIILDYVKKVDFSSITSIAQVEASIINDLMDTLWDIAQSELASYTSNQLVKYIIEKSLTIDNVRGLAEHIFTSSSQVQKVYTARYGAVLAAHIEHAEEEERLAVDELTAITTGIEKGNKIDYEVNPMNPGPLLDNTEVVQKINNPVDKEEEDLDSAIEDGTAEVVSTEEEVVDDVIASINEKVE